MTFEELKKLVEYEIQWLNYYSNRASKNNLNENSNIYEVLKTIGYTKRPIKLDIRCSPCTLTSDVKIQKGTDLSKLFKINEHRGENKYSPLETFILIYPEMKNEIINKLTN